MGKMKFTNIVDIVGTSVQEFSSRKTYVSTGALDVDHIDFSSTEDVDFNTKPSRANLEVKKGNLIFAKMMATQKTLCIDDVTEKMIFSTGFCAVSPKPNIITSRCLYYLLSSEFFLALKDKHCSGATQKAITNEGLEKIIINVPAFSEQNRITATLDKVTNLINLRKKELEKLDLLVKSRFVEMFGDIISNNKQWKVCQFSGITSSRLGKMLDAKQQTGNYLFPYLANANVQWFRFETNNLNQMDFNENDQVEFSLKDGDLLVCEGGEIGRCAIWHNQIQPCFFQKALHRVRCNQEIVIPEYLAWWFKFNCENNGFADIEGAKATIAHLTGAKLKQLQVVVPPLELQKKFAEYIKQTDKSKYAVKKSLEKLETLKKALMQEYFG